MANLALPGNPRYQPKSLEAYFGYDNLYCPVAMVEIATLRTLGEIGVIPAADIALFTSEIEERLLAITTTEVDKVEREITKHDIRAWVRLAQEILPPPLRRWIHVPLTSYDPLDTARSLQFVRAHFEVVRPAVSQVVRLLIEKVRQYAATVQIGRTHGQHALPITVGFWLATILNRLVYNAKQADAFAESLVGKISGAVGAYNAEVGLGIRARCRDTTLERMVLAKLDLKPALISTQILQPEPLAYYLFSCTMMSATLGQLGRDCRQLMRTEIGEVNEQFERGQVGSSTMAHKRNPINFESLEGMWLRTKNEFGKVFDTMISEHQRDLVGSSVARDLPTIIVNLVYQLNVLLRPGKDGRSFLERIAVDEEACKRNLKLQGDVILAEPIYIALQMAGYEGDAHELVNRQAMPLVQKYGRPLLDVVRMLALEDPSVAPVWDRIPPEVLELLSHPEQYVGWAAAKAHEVIALAEDYVRSSE